MICTVTILRTTTMTLHLILDRLRTGMKRSKQKCRISTVLRRGKPPSFTSDNNQLIQGKTAHLQQTARSPLISRVT